MSDSKVEIKVPEELIRGIVVGEVAAALGRNGGRERMLEMIVRRALEEKKDSWSKETKFDDALKEMINKVATEVMEEWLETNKAAIKKALTAALEKNKKSVLMKLVDDLQAGMAWISPKIHLSIEKDG